MTHPVVFALLALAADTDPLGPLVKKLGDKAPAVRVAALKELAGMGADAAPAARAVCDALLDPNPEVAVAASRAVDAVAPKVAADAKSLAFDIRPDHVGRTLHLLDKDPTAERVHPVAGLILRRMVTWRTQFAINDMSRALSLAALRVLRRAGYGGDDAGPVVASLLAPDVPREHQSEALWFAAGWAKGSAARREAVAPALRAGLASQALSPVALDAVALWGKDGAEFAPLVRQLVVAKSATVRQRAEKCLKAIRAD